MVAGTSRLCARTNIDIDYWDRAQIAVPISLSPLTVLLQALAKYMELIVFSLEPHCDGGGLMSEPHPIIYLARHGETAWSLSGQHTGLTDLPLTERGRRNACRLGERLKGLTFTKVLTSPLQRAAETCHLAGFGASADVDRDLLEWDYGQYEGLRTAEIQAERPEWQLFRDGCPGGETPDQVAARADRVVNRVRGVQGDMLLFSSGHFLRMLAVRWLGLGSGSGSYIVLGTASLSVLGYEHNRSEPVIRLWNDTRHVGL
jgi:probable phosphoglycerate mutase